MLEDFRRDRRVQDHLHFGYVPVFASRSLQKNKLHRMDAVNQFTAFFSDESHGNLECKNDDVLISVAGGNLTLEK